MSLKAYQAAQAKTEDPRVTEYRLFGQVTGALLTAKESNAVGTPLVEAIDWNRRLWRTLAADCMDDRNTLTQDVRAKIISLSLWVSKYSPQRDPRKGAAGSADRDQPHHHAGPPGLLIEAALGREFQTGPGDGAGFLLPAPPGKKCHPRQVMPKAFRRRTKINQQYQQLIKLMGWHGGCKSFCG